MKMSYDYNEIFSLISELVASFCESGYAPKPAQRLASRLEAEENSPLGMLISDFTCNAFESIAVALGLAAQVDPELAKSLALCFDCTPGSINPHALCRLIFGSQTTFECAEILDGDGILARFFDQVSPRFDTRMTLRDSIADFLLTGRIDRRLKPLTRADAVDTYIENAVESIVGAITVQCELPYVVHISGTPGSGRRTSLKVAAERCDLDFALIDLREPIGLTAREISTLLELANAYPAILADESSEQTLPATTLATLRELAHECRLAVLISEHPLNPDGEELDIISVQMPLPGIGEQAKIWRRKSEYYTVDESVDFREIASEFNLSPGKIDKAFRYASIRSSGKLTAQDIKLGCYASVGSHMGSRAVKVDSAFTWDDLVLPKQSKAMLRSAFDYVRCGYTVFEHWNFGAKLPYGRGASMIFTGPPGTGKTMAAQVIAHELGLELRKVNLASVVSKYIGETEKNLNDIFERAKKSRVVLFFDEADVLFGKRTEVKDSNDKYSNMEAAFLLQKIEEYNGIAILATNFVQNFDEAFKRRMKFLVEFPFPDRDRRAELWKKAFPREAPTDEIDYDYLVENFELSGSNIKNIALHSAFSAASDGSDAIGMKHIVAALRNEFAKSGKSFTKAEAGEYFYYLDD